MAELRQHDSTQHGPGVLATSEVRHRGDLLRLVQVPDARDIHPGAPIPAHAGGAARTERVTRACGHLLPRRPDDQHGRPAAAVAVRLAGPPVRTGRLSGGAAVDEPQSGQPRYPGWS
jgi:hypothetical protein